MRSWKRVVFNRCQWIAAKTLSVSVTVTGFRVQTSVEIIQHVLSLAFDRSAFIDNKTAVGPADKGHPASCGDRRATQSGAQPIFSANMLFPPCRHACRPGLALGLALSLLLHIIQLFIRYKINPKPDPLFPSTVACALWHTHRCHCII